MRPVDWSLTPELAAAGHKFKSRCDTEVLVHGYEEWGEGLLDRIDGMFAFAIWDARRRRLFAARDRMGKKPLYCRLLNDGVACASELPALMMLAPSEWTEDLDSTADFLRYG